MTMIVRSIAHGYTGGIHVCLGICLVLCTFTCNNCVSLEMGPRWDDGVYLSILNKDLLNFAEFSVLHLLQNKVTTQCV